MPPRSEEELPLKRLLRVLLSLLVVPGCLHAQEADSTGRSPGRVDGFLELSARLVRVEGETAPLLGGALLVGLPRRWRAGGAAFVLAERVAQDAAPGALETELRMGYGGALLAWSSGPDGPAPSARSAGLSPRWSLALLVGAGNAELRDIVSGVRLRSDNFFLLEPAVTVELELLSRLSTGVLAGYRVPLGVEDLNGLQERDLGGWTMGVSARLGPF